MSQMFPCDDIFVYLGFELFAGRTTVNLMPTNILQSSGEQMSSSEMAVYQIVFVD